MDSAVYDMGGVQEWFGPIPVEADEPVFHHRWEARVFASLLDDHARCSASARRRSGGRRSAFPERSTSPATTSGGSPPSSDCWSIRACSRRESSTRASPESTRRSAATRGRARFAERCRASSFALRWGRCRTGWRACTRGSRTCIVPKAAPPRFAIGDRVAVSAAPTAPAEIHTRRPRYTWGKRGTVVGYHFATVLPERSARGEHGAGEHFYTVEFDGRELWGDGAEPGTAVRIDLFESYLEATS